MSNRSQPLEVKIDNGRLVISIGVDTLAYAFENSDGNMKYNDEHKDWLPVDLVEDKDVFASEVIVSMLKEDEDGSTSISRYLDDTMMESVNYGNLGILDEEIKQDD